MAYNSKTYGGITGFHMPARETAAAASPSTTDSFVKLVASLRPNDAPGSGSFKEIFRHDGQPIAVTFHPEQDDRSYLPAVNQPLGLAAAYNVASRRKLLWQKGRNPGIYTITKTVYVEPVRLADPETGLQTGLRAQAKVRETTRPLAAYGDPEETVDTRRATEADVTQAIEMLTQAYDTIFMDASGMTMEYPPLNSPDNPGVPRSIYPPM